MSKNNDIRVLVNKQKIISNYKRCKNYGSVYYPLKTNTNRIVLNTLNEVFRKNDGFLISNLEHFQILKKLNVSPESICLINVFTNDKIIKYLYEEGVRYFVFDDIKSLIEFSKYADLRECKISIRLNIMEVFNDIVTHLGASKFDSLKMLDMLNGKCKSVGISFYLQKIVQCREHVLKMVIDFILKEFGEYKLNFLSMAGLKYDEFHVSDFENIKQILNLDEIIIEPGKFLVGDTIDLETHVIRCKNIKEKTMIIIQNGIYSGMLDVVLYNEKFQIYLNTGSEFVPFKYEKDEINNYEVYVCGASSDSRDVIGTMYINERYKNNLGEGVDILIKDVGSYFEVFFMNYGGDINRKIVEV